MARKPSIEARAKQLLTQAQQLEQEGATWVQAHNVLFGLGGAAAQLFTTRQERTAFAQTSQHDEIHKILGQLEQPQNHAGPAPSQTSGKILVRVPTSIHAALLAEAEAEGVSLNQLIVSKLSAQLRSLVS